MKNATLFGGGLNITNSLDYKETIKIGELLAEYNFTVKNGGYKGLMEAVSKGVSNNEGTVIGVTCASFKSTKGNEYLSETIVEGDHSRRHPKFECSPFYVIALIS